VQTNNGESQLVPNGSIEIPVGGKSRVGDSRLGVRRISHDDCFESNCAELNKWASFFFKGCVPERHFVGSSVSDSGGVPRWEEPLHV
jgi:hypothetical protein